MPTRHSPPATRLPPLASRHSPPAFRSLHEALVLGGLLVVALALRLFRLGAIDFMHDEVISRFAALAPASRIFSELPASDTHPPLYHIMLHVWGMGFGYELVPLRLMSVLLGLLCVPAAWQLGRALFNHRVGLIAAGLIAVSPFQILHSQQARMYTLLTLLVLLATLAFANAWRRGGFWRWALLCLAATAGFYTHVYFAFSLLGLNLWALADSIAARRLDRGRWAGLVLAQAGAVLLFGPFVLNMLELTSGVVENFWISTVSPLAWLFALATMLNYATLRVANPPLWHLLLVFLPALVAIMGSVGYALGRVRQQPTERAAWLLLLFAVFTPCALAMALSLTIRPILLDRSLIGVSGPLCVLLAAVFVRTWPGRISGAAAAALAVSIGIMLPAVYPATPQPHSLAPTIDAVFAERQPGDAVIVLDWQSFDYVALRYSDAQDVYVGSVDSKVAYWQRRMRFMDWHTPAQAGPPAAYAERYSRVWVVHTRYTYPDDWQTVQGWLAATMRLVDEREIDRTTIQRYEARPSLAGAVEADQRPRRNASRPPRALKNTIRQRMQRATPSAVAAATP